MRILCRAMVSAACVLVACVLGACAAPQTRLHQPLPTTPVAFKAASAPGVTPFEAPQAELAGAWWRVFDDAVLDGLVQRAEHGNTELAVAAARLAAAQALLAGTRAAGQPQLGGSLSAGRQGGPLVNAAGTEGSLFTAGAQLSYELDLSGRLAQAQDAAALDAQARASQLRGERLRVQAEVAQAYLALRATDAERGLAQRSLQAWQQTLRISEERWRLGSVAELAVLRQRANLQAAQADALALERRRAELENALALLLGEAASGFALAELPAWAPRVPAIPSGIPSDMLLRRPDVAAAAQQLQAAQARTASAQRAGWPSLSLTASGGQASATLGELLHASMRAFSLGALLAAPLLDGGRRAAGVALAEADDDAALAQHRARVLTAFKEVEDQLVALRLLAQQAGHQAQACAAATRAAALADSRWRQGLASHLELLETQRSAWLADVALLHTQSAQAQATVGLIRALGGGWGEAEVRAPVQQPAPRAQQAGS